MEQNRREVAEKVLAEMERRGAQNWKLEETVDGEFLLVGDTAQKSTRGAVSPLPIATEATADAEMDRIVGIRDIHTNRTLFWHKPTSKWHVLEADMDTYREYKSTRKALARLEER